MTMVPAIMEMVTTCYNNRFVGDVADYGYGDGDRGDDYAVAVRLLCCSCCCGAVRLLLSPLLLLRLPWVLLLLFCCCYYLVVVLVSPGASGIRVGQPLQQTL